MDYLNELQKIEKQCQEARINKAKLDQKLQSLQEEQIKLQEELKTLNVTEETLAQTIAEITEEIEIQFQQCNEALK
jgi:hypothetical protein